MAISRSTALGARPRASSSIMQQLGGGHHHPGQGQHLLLAPRQRAGRLVEAGGQLGEAVDGLVEGRPGPAALPAQRVGPDAAGCPAR